jgi:hypothetical protein
MNQMHKRRDWCNERRDFWYERFLKEVFWGNSGCGKPEFMKAGASPEVQEICKPCFFNSYLLMIPD